MAWPLGKLKLVSRTSWVTSVGLTRMKTSFSPRLRKTEIAKLARMGVQYFCSRTSMMRKRLPMTSARGLAKKVSAMKKPVKGAERKEATLREIPASTGWIMLMPSESPANTATSSATKIHLPFCRIQALLYLD